MLSRIAYHQAARLVTLSEANRKKQLSDGADPAKIVVVPNGVKGAAGEPVAPGPRPAAPGPMRVGFVGRVVPIKDVITLIRAISLARDKVDLVMSIIGPEDEDPVYARRCRELVAKLDLEDQVKFLGPQPSAQVYPNLDVVVLTSLSEGQPLVVLEAHAAGVPVIATDVGACRELIEGGDEVDRKLGPSGIVTRVACPSETAAALCVLAGNPELRAAMGRNGQARVNARYQLRHVVAHYDALYASMVI
jgi:glycosyltransferase involved in cell wall biosynthesis